jgi:arylsulfatase A-like enzyme
MNVLSGENIALRLEGIDLLMKENFDGVNLLPYLRAKDPGRPNDTLKWRFTISAAIRVGDWKLIRLPDRLPMLFNLKTDLSEQHDVALANLDVTRKLLRELGDWDVNLPHPLFLEGAVWKHKQLNLCDATYPLTQPAGGAAPVMVPRSETNS